MEKLADVLSQNIKDYCGIKNNTYIQVGAKTNISERNIRKIVHQECIPRIDTVEKIANGLGVPVVSLVTKNGIVDHFRNNK